MSISGQLMKSETVNTEVGFNQKKINLQYLSSGMYYLVIERNGKQKQIEKIIIE
jgi:hypothetical protein